MDRTLVVAIGISKYDTSTAPPLPTASLDALRVARRLQAMGVTADHTYVFVQPVLRTADERTAFDDLKNGLAAGTHLTESCTHETLERFWRQDLRQLATANPNGRLLLYWTGHGFTEERTGLPSLLCSDWTDALATRVVGRLDLLETLHSPPYAGLGSQLIVFDACANTMVTGATPPVTANTWAASIDQVSLSSAARGKYAHGDDRGGLFTRLFLEGLQAIDEWPDLELFARAVQSAVATSGQQSTPVLYRRGRGDDEIWRRTNPARDRLVSTLEGMGIGPTKLKPLYLAVASALSREPGRGTGTTIPQMVDDLWNANGSASSSAAPYPAVEFAQRVRDVFEVPAVDAWLADTVCVRPSDRAEARQRLADEGSGLFLVVELMESRSEKRTGEIESFKAMLLRYDHTTVAEPWVAEQHDVLSWDDLVARLRPLLIAARDRADLDDVRLTIEFVTNVFDIEPHLIPLDPLAPDTLGEHNPVTLRLRSRRSADVRGPWLSWAERIRQGQVSTCVHVVAVGTPGFQPCQVLFVRHPLPHGSRPAHPQPPPPEWQLVRRAINAGIPFICWPLRQRAAADFSDFEQELLAWVQGTLPVDRLPARVREERSAGTLALDVNVFWDDPLPTWQLREIRMG